MALGGILAGAVGGAARAGEEVANQRIRQRDELAAKRQALFDAMEAKLQLAGFEDGIEDGRRQRQQDTITARMRANAAADLDQVYGDPVYGDEPLTPDQRQVLDEGLRRQRIEREREQLRMMRDPRRRLEAATEEGYVAPDVLADMDAKEQQQAVRNEIDLLKADQRTDATKPPAGYRETEGGGLEPIPGGPADEKRQQDMIADQSQMQDSIAGLDRLALETENLMNHPGLSRITGIVGKLPNFPGGNAADAQALLETVRSQVGFGVLQAMRAASKTGGALGNVSDAEGKRLEANLAALDTAQSYDQFRDSLQKIIDYTAESKTRLRDAYQAKYGERQRDDGAPTINDPSELNDKPAGFVFRAPDDSLRVKQ